MTEKSNPESDAQALNCTTAGVESSPPDRLAGWKRFFASRRGGDEGSSGDSNEEYKDIVPTAKWSLGILNDKKTEEVPGTVLLLSSTRNEPLGLQHQPQRLSASSLPSPLPPRSMQGSLYSTVAEKKKTADGQIFLDPQPDDSLNDPLNWPTWRRDSALLSLGFYCMLGGGMTPILAAGFNDVAETYDVTPQRVALTTGLFMMGLGLGSVIASPTAILFGKRPVYLFSAILFILSAVWCALAPSFTHLIVARILQGAALSPVECLPSATIAEIFFLHERAFRVGIYTLLLLGGKNLVPLVSAAIINSLEWRWVFWIVALIGGFCLVLLFLFVPETFWDRTPRPRSRRPSAGQRSISNLFRPVPRPEPREISRRPSANVPEDIRTPRQQKLHHLDAHAHFEDVSLDDSRDRKLHLDLPTYDPVHSEAARVAPSGNSPPTPVLHTLNSPYYLSLEANSDYLGHHSNPPDAGNGDKDASPADVSRIEMHPVREKTDPEAALQSRSSLSPRSVIRYTTDLQTRPPKTFVQALTPWNGRLSKCNWLLVSIRPFILFTYPSILWSAVVYSLSIGWLIVLSESVAEVYRNKATYNFSALGTGLVYLSPFIGGVLGTAVAGKVSDMIVRSMSRRNGGVYEPEFRLVMAAPIALTTAIGLMGFGWSAEEKDRWIVPTVFFGIISFGCSLGSTTSITFCVDSYRQYAGEALVTLNFSKNIFHGLVFSLFFPHWLHSDGPKDVFLIIGCIQVACLLTTIPMYIYGKRARMWTVRNRWMERF